MASTLTIRELITKWGFDADTTPIQALDRQIEKVKEKAAKTGEGFKTMGESISRVGMGMSAAITLPLALAGAGMVKLAADAEESASKFAAVFRDQTADMTAWSEEFATAANRSAVALRDQASTFGALFDAMKFGGKESANLSKTMTQLTTDLASFNNEAEPDVLIALRSGLLGNVEPVIKYGADVRVAAVNQELLNMGIKGGAKAATEQQKIMARLNIIMKATKTAQGDAVKTSESFTNQMKGLKASLEEAAVAFGKIIIPMLKPFVKALGEAMRILSKLGPTTRTLVVIFAGFAASLGPLLLIAGHLLTMIGTVMKLKVAFGGLALAGKLAWLSMLGPIALVVAAIAGAAALIYAYWDEIQDFMYIFWQEFFGFIENARGRLATVADAIMGLLAPILNVLISATEAIGKFFAWLWGKVSWIFDKIIAIPSWMGNIMGQVVEIIKQKLLGVLSWGAQKLGKVWSWLFGDEEIGKSVNLNVEQMQAGISGMTPGPGGPAPVGAAAVAGATSQVVQAPITVNVPPGTDTSLAERVGDATSTAAAQSYRRALGDLGR